MKKYAFLLALPLIILVAGCNNDEKIDITDTNIDLESCDKYFEMMECVLQNDNDEDYTESERNQLRQTVKDKQAEWEWLDQEILDEKCNLELEKFNAIEDRLENIWCALK